MSLNFCLKADIKSKRVAFSERDAHVGTRFAFNFEPFTNAHVTYFEPFTNAHVTYPTFMRRYVSRIDYVGRTQWLSFQLSNHCRLTPLSKSHLVPFFIFSNDMMQIYFDFFSKFLLFFLLSKGTNKPMCTKVLNSLHGRYLPDRFTVG